MAIGPKRMYSGRLRRHPNCTAACLSRNTDRKCMSLLLTASKNANQLWDNICVLRATRKLVRFHRSGNSPLKATYLHIKALPLRFFKMSVSKILVNDKKTWHTLAGMITISPSINNYTLKDRIYLGFIPCSNVTKGDANNAKETGNIDHSIYWS